MATPWLAASFLVSVLVPLIEAWTGLALARGSHAALALGPWLLAALLPPRGAVGGSWGRSLHVGALALPPLCLGAGLDAAAGTPLPPLASTVLAGWLVLLAWSSAAQRSARTRAGHRAFALAWLLLLPGLATLRVALGWAAVRSGAPAPRAGTLFAIDPWIWWHRWAREGGLEHLTASETTVVLLGAVLVWALVSTGERLAEGRA